MAGQMRWWSATEGNNGACTQVRYAGFHEVARRISFKLNNRIARGEAAAGQAVVVDMELNGKEILSTFPSCNIGICQLRGTSPSHR